MGLERADNSLLWRSIQMQHALRNCRTVRLSRCAFGGGYRHKMRVSFFHVPLEINPTVRMCSDKHICTFSRKRHLIPTGTARGVYVTRMLERYPRELAAFLATGFQHALAIKATDRLKKLGW